MIRAMVMANDSLIVDSIASILTRELRLDVLQLTYSLPLNDDESIRNHRSVVIRIDDGEPGSGAVPGPSSGQYDGPCLLMKASLKTMNLHVSQDHQLDISHMEHVTQLVRDFSRTYLNKIDEKIVTWAI